MSQAARPGGALDRLAFEMARCPFHDFLQPTPVSADPDAGTVVVRVENRPALGLSRSGDGIHGGVLAALIDIVGHATIAVQLGRPAAAKVWVTQP